MSRVPAKTPRGCGAARHRFGLPRPSACTSHARLPGMRPRPRAAACARAARARACRWTSPCGTAGRPALPRAVGLRQPPSLACCAALLRARRAASHLESKTGSQSGEPQRLLAGSQTRGGRRSVSGGQGWRTRSRARHCCNRRCESRHADDIRLPLQRALRGPITFFCHLGPGPGGAVLPPLAIQTAGLTNK